MTIFFFTLSEVELNYLPVGLYQFDHHKMGTRMLDAVQFALQIGRNELDRTELQIIDSDYIYSASYPEKEAKP